MKMESGSFVGDFLHAKKTNHDSKTNIWMDAYACGSKHWMSE
jgi:hypothetical protein